MIIKTFTEPPIENNNYLIIDEESGEAALVDYSAVDDNILLAIKKQGAVLKYILLTHGHFDHIAGIRPEMYFPAINNKPQIVMHRADLNILNKVNQFLPMFGIPDISIPQIDIFVDDNDILKLGKLDIKVIYTPGHTQGGVCYLINNNLFSGDTIFREAVGRCDLEGGDFNQLHNSITSKLFTLPDETVIYPGHGKMTNVAWEKEHNQFL